MMSRYLASILAAAMLCTNANAQTLTECGKLEGYAFFFSGGAMPADKSGWQKDAISGFVILNFANDEFDLIIKDSMRTTSVKPEGERLFCESQTLKV
jgi:hypothetical protein